jgi:hypothetical protein
VSLVIAAHNGKDIVVACDSRSMITASDGSTASSTSIEKVTVINPGLALIITGRYMSDKLDVIKQYVGDVQNTPELDAAFGVLCRVATKEIVLHGRGEGFRIGLAGFNLGVPTFKCVTIRDGYDPLLEGANSNYYLSGERTPVELAEAKIGGVRLAESLTAALERTVRAVLGECIDECSGILGGPVDSWTLSRPIR